MNKAELNQLAKSLRPAVDSAIQCATDEILTVEGVAKMLGVTVNAIYIRCNKGQIPYKKRGKRLYFSKNALLNYYLGS